MNKQIGGIARQFVLGAVQTTEGLPLFHTVHPGNMADAKTLTLILVEAAAPFWAAIWPQIQGLRGASS